MLIAFIGNGLSAPCAQAAPPQPGDYAHKWVHCSDQAGQRKKYKALFEAQKEFGFMVANARTILIADPNPHVRGFLKREMTAAGYDVKLAINLQELLYLAFQHNAVDLIIVDPDFPNVSVHDLLTRLTNRIPAIPVVVHTHDVSVGNDLEKEADLLIVEKRGNSIERLKQLAAQWLTDISGCPAAAAESKPAQKESGSAKTGYKTEKHPRRPH